MSELNRTVQWDQLCGNFPTGQDLQDPYTKLSFNLVQEEYNDELIPFYEEGNVTEVLDAIGDSFKVLSQLAYSLSVHPDDILKEVNDSNFSKFCYSEEDAKQSVENYATDNRYHSVHYELKDDVYVILGFKNNQNPETDKPKVLKGINFVEPDFTKFIK